MKLKNLIPLAALLFASCAEEQSLTPCRTTVPLGISLHARPSFYEIDSGEQNDGSGGGQTRAPCTDARTTAPELWTLSGTAATPAWKTEQARLRVYTAMPDVTITLTAGKAYLLNNAIVEVGGITADKWSSCDGTPLETE